MADPVIFASLGLILLISVLAAICSRDNAGIVLFLFVSFVGVAVVFLMCQAKIPALAVLCAALIGGCGALFFWGRQNNFDKSVLLLQFRGRIWLLLAVSGLLIAEIIVIIAIKNGNGHASSSALAPTGFPAPDDRTLEQTIVSDYLFAFGLAGMIILTAALGACLILRPVSDFKAARSEFLWGGKRNRGKGDL